MVTFGSAVVEDDPCMTVEARVYSVRGWGGGATSVERLPP
jgi:hypothetical protein